MRLAVQPAELPAGTRLPVGLAHEARDATRPREQVDEPARSRSTTHTSSSCGGACFGFAFDCGRVTSVGPPRRRDKRQESRSNAYITHLREGTLHFDCFNCLPIDWALRRVVFLSLETGVSRFFCFLRPRAPPLAPPHELLCSRVHVCTPPHCFPGPRVSHLSSSCATSVRLAPFGSAARSFGA